MRRSSTATVLANPELLQFILLQCDPHTLLTSAQRVCHRWHACIATSPAIQRHLFLRPIDIMSSAPTSQSTRAANPLLEHPFSLWMQHSRPETGFVTLDEMLARLPTAAAAADPGCENAFLRSGASWRHMLVAQPPITSLGVLKQLPRIGESFAHLREQIFFPEGLRMGELVDLTVQILEEERGYATFRVAWTRPFGPEEYIAFLLQQFNRGLMSFGPEVGAVLFFMGSRPRSRLGEETIDRWQGNVDVRLKSKDYQARTLVLQRVPSGYESMGNAFWQQ